MGVVMLSVLTLHRTMVGRGRAWLRFVLMQKKLADNFRLMIENRGKLRYCLPVQYVRELVGQFTIYSPTTIYSGFGHAGISYQSVLIIGWPLFRGVRAVI